MAQLLPGQMQALGEPGAKAGFFAPISPKLTDVHVRVAELHPNLVAKINDSVSPLVVKNGTCIARDKTDKNVGSLLGSRFKIVTTAASNNWEVTVANSLDGIFPVFTSSYAPDAAAAGKMSYIAYPMMVAQTDAVNSGYSAPAIGDLLLPGADGLLITAGATATNAIGKVIAVQLSYPVVSGATVTLLTVMYRGPWIF